MKQHSAAVGGELVEEAALEEAATAADATAVSAPPASDQAPAESKDIGNWKHGLWKGLDFWTNRRTHRTSFKKDYVRKHRHE